MILFSLRFLILKLLIYWFTFDIGCSITLDDLVEDRSWVTTTSTRSVVLEDELAEFEDALGSRLDVSSEDDDDGPIDCFGLSPLLQRVFRWMFQPQDTEKINVRFFLTTRKSRSRLELQKNPEDGFRSAGLRKNGDVVLIIHGFMSNSDMFWVHDMADALLDKSDTNVVAVDWGGGSLSWKYWRAVGNTRVVGDEVAEFLKQLFLRGLSRSQIHCIGHSLGAHICSFAAKKVGPFGRITGLDPAQPCFKDNGLGVEDANYVDVVHTNTNLFGRSEPLGSQDFYPNGGKMQPGCVLRDTKLLSKFPITRKKLESAICSHGRSYEFFIDALRSRQCTFWGHLWDFSSTGALDMMKHSCSLRTCVPMGLESDQYPGKGPYYVPTMEKTPFCISDANATKVMKMSKKIKKMIKKKF